MDNNQINSQDLQQDAVLSDNTETNTSEYTREEFEKIIDTARKRGVRKGVICTLIGVSVAAVIIFAAVICASFSGGGKKTSRYTSLADETFVNRADYLWAFVQEKFLWQDRVDEDATRDAMYKALLESLDDPYTCYYTADEFKNMMEGVEAEYSGIGAYIVQEPDTGLCYISRPMPDSPAEEAGIRPGDYIYTVDGENVAGRESDVIVSMIKGPEGTTVDIGVRHENKGEIEVITTERRKIIIQELEYEMIDDKIGYIWLYEFERQALPQFQDAFYDLKDQGMEGLIIDLRDNPGGDYDTVCDLTDMFLDGGTIIYTKDNKGGGETVTADAECEKLPIVILVNGNSASASEVFTGALKTRGVATVVGTTTFGKGIIQAIYNLDGGAGMKLTDSEYYLPNDECIHGVGIEPDYEIELDIEKYMEDKSDNQKEKAIEVMKGLLK